jgi:hypothetical protein
VKKGSRRIRAYSNMLREKHLRHAGCGYNQQYVFYLHSPKVFIS